MGWRDKPYECTVCGWQGMRKPSPPHNDAVCPECDTLMMPRSWTDTWGVTLTILGIVVVVILFVAFVPQWL